MNEKIKTLAEQAGADLIDERPELQDMDLEKFAELIVKECANICITQNLSMLSLDELNTSSFNIQQLVTKSCGEQLSKTIKKHFGVD